MLYHHDQRDPAYIEGPEAAIQVNPEPGYGQTQELPPLKEE